MDPCIITRTFNVARRGINANKPQEPPRIKCQDKVQTPPYLRLLGNMFRVITPFGYWASPNNRQSLSTNILSERVPSRFQAIKPAFYTGQASVHPPDRAHEDSFVRGKVTVKRTIVAKSIRKGPMQVGPCPGCGALAPTDLPEFSSAQEL